MSNFSFDDSPKDRLTAADVLKSYTGNITAAKNTPALPPPAPKKETLPTESKPAEKAKIEKDLEHEYLDKAYEYLNSLPTGGATTDYVKDAAVKLRRSYAPSPPVPTFRYLEAIVAYCTGLGKSGPTAITKEFLQQTLDQGKGNFLQLCAALIDEKVIAIDKLEEVVCLCKAVVGVLQDNVKLQTPIPNTEDKPQATASTAEVKPVSKDPMDNMKTWPTQEKRDNRKS
jgi:hypothetical protein